MPAEPGRDRCRILPTGTRSVAMTCQRPAPPDQQGRSQAPPDRQAGTRHLVAPDHDQMAVVLAQRPPAYRGAGADRVTDRPAGEVRGRRAEEQRHSGPAEELLPGWAAAGSAVEE